MVFTIPTPADVAAGLYKDLRQTEWDPVDLDILLDGLAGTGVISGCEVTAQTTPDMTVSVAAGEIVRVTGRTTMAQANTSLAAADPTDPRFDLIVEIAGIFIGPAGTPAPNPVFPSIPVGGCVLGAIWVPPSETAITTAHRVDKRCLLLDYEPVWTAPTLLNGWLDYGGTYETASYAKDHQGAVRLKGLLKDGTLDQAAFVLPADHRPVQTSIHSVVGSTVVGRVEISTAGEVKPRSLLGLTNSWVSLSGISFMAG